MIQKDYVERMLEQIAELTAKLTGLPMHQKKSYIQELAIETLKINLEDLEKIDNKDLIGYLIAENLNIFQIEFLVLLLFEEIKVLLDLNLDTEKKIPRAIILFEYIFEKSEEYNLELRNKYGQLLKLENDKK